MPAQARGRAGRRSLRQSCFTSRLTDGGGGCSPRNGPHNDHHESSLHLAVLASAACGGDAGEDRPAIVPQPLLSDIQAKIFTPSCAAFSACHNPSGQAGHCDLTPGKTYADIVNHTSSTNKARVLVVPGKPEESFLIAKLRGELGSEDGDPMPLRNPSLDEPQIQAIEAWIAAGALDK